MCAEVQAAAEPSPTPVMSQPCVQRLGMPRRPGVYPPDYPMQRILKEAPTPGQPLSLPELPSRPRCVTAPLISVRSPCVAESHSFDDAEASDDPRKMVNRRLTLRVKKPKPIATEREFPDVDVPVPKFKAKSFQYPSGNPNGTMQFRPFETRLRELLVTHAAPSFK